ncbi:putative 2OG-Fe(II) oxygenase [Cognatilysobacter tabacisoli]|uniref:putative 2OG-Fe(II) oxygenase n=1 Tax=Cognatilysobacter tabacisoli TaxID=2315424 RepID=UPI000E6B3BF6|nr:putative 2OG-Fe(II) oxygenase [Lysobacter tabacisoli]
MPYEINPVFAVPLAHDTLPNAGALNAELKALILAREAEGDRYANPHPSLKQQPGVFESDFNLFSWPEACVQQLRQFCWATLGRTIQQINGYEAEEMQRLQIFSHTWFHVTRYGGFTILHTHPMASWSGVYCVDPGETPADRPESGVLRFHNPHHYSHTFLDAGNLRPRAPYHHGTWSVRFGAGQLVLFPSWLQHEVLPFYGRDERITIAFNCWFGMKDA